MLIDILREINNFFVVSQEKSHFKIENGLIELNGNYVVGQYIAIERKTKLCDGSILNGGVYLLKDTLYTLEGAVDEEWNGTVYGLSIPHDLLKLAEEIELFNASKEGAATSIISESFGAQSYSRSTGADGLPAGWQSIFAKRLAKYKTKMFAEVSI